MNRRTERLEKALARVAREQGIDQERLRRWVSFLAVCGVLERRIKPEKSTSTTLREELRWSFAMPTRQERQETWISDWAEPANSGWTYCNGF